MNPYSEILRLVQKDPAYLAGIEYGEPRRGHDEGTVKAHIAQLEDNLRQLMYSVPLTVEWHYKLLTLIHVHDTLKGRSHELRPGKRSPAIDDPVSHASLAREFLSKYTTDPDLLRIVQYHDVGYAVYKKFKKTGRLDEQRLRGAIDPIQDKDLFLMFCVIDACTPYKGREMILWFVNWLGSNYLLSHGLELIAMLPGSVAKDGIF